MKKIYIQRTLAAAAFLLVATETLVRGTGIVDFPIYTTDKEIGYFPVPNQSGKFLNKNAWYFNDRSMPTKVPWNPTAKPNVLLIGNSIVMGGNPYNQPDKLGPLVQEKLGSGVAVWPVAVGAWSTVNESAYLRRNPDIAQASSFFVWEYMNGGLSKLSLDRGQYIFPTEKPWFASWYVLRRYVLPLLIDFKMDELPPSGQTQSENLQQFEKLVASMSAGKAPKVPGMLFFYPGRDEYMAFQKGVDYVPDRLALQAIAATYHLKIVDVAQRPEWNLSLYKEGTHPTVEGNKVLADILASAVREAMSMQ